MEHHGDNPLKNAVAIIPARYESVRLPGKMLLAIAGKPLILHTAEQAAKAETVSDVIVATDDERIRDVAAAAGFNAVMTSADHRSGSDRIAEVAQSLTEGTIVVNVQGDEPMISPATIDLAVRAMQESDADIVTTWERIENEEEAHDPNVVKVVTDSSGRALYFSRSVIPFNRSGSRAIELKKHTGLYVYRREYLLNFTKMEQTPLEKAEMLEQLRALENGAYIKVIEAPERSIGVDTEADLEKVRAMVAGIKPGS